MAPRARGRVHRLRRILITAGPTREMLDPVRFLSNLSTGSMGYRLAGQAKAQGYKITLVSGPTFLKPPRGVRVLPILSARDLERVCRREFARHDALIMTAAVCDFAPVRERVQKIRRTQTRSILLKQTPDIVAGLAKRKGRRLVIGFSLETQNWLENARLKLRRKNLDGMVANVYSARHIPFGDRQVSTAFVGRGGEIRRLGRRSKAQIAKALLKWLESVARSGE